MQNDPALLLIPNYSFGVQIDKPSDFKKAAIPPPMNQGDNFLKFFLVINNSLKLNFTIINFFQIYEALLKFLKNLITLFGINSLNK